MEKIMIEQNPSPERLDAFEVFSWPIWEKEVSRFPWTYDKREICFFLEGDVIVTPDGGEPVRMGKGDLVSFPPGMSCTWEVLQPVRKHYQFE